MSGFGITYRRFMIYKLSNNLRIGEIVIDEDFDYLDTLGNPSLVTERRAVECLRKYDGSLTLRQATEVVKGWVESYGR